ncbi:MAG: hypothetical protein JXA62_03115 [Candidatus Aminicenantes bacterium]|nr:hypothetical protein [Candidatus Aminicenantes bacterium]
MKFRLGCLLLAVWLPLVIPGQGSQALADRTAAAIAEIMASRYNQSATVISFENHTEWPDMAVQKFYQLLVSGLENTPQKSFEFHDRMVAFSSGSGRFQAHQLREIGFLIALKMIRSGTRVGVGITVFSRRADRMVAVRYVSEEIPAGELRILNQPEQVFAGTGFSMTARLEADSLLMDVCSRAEPNGQVRHYFLSPDKVDVFEWRERRMMRLITLPLEWKRPITPARRIEGHLLVFHNQVGSWLTIGANISTESLVFLRSDGNWEARGALNFVPIRHLEINDTPYLAGMRYASGRNYFHGDLVLMPLTEGRPDRDRLYEKPLPAAFSVDFTARDGRLTGLHMIDRDYRYRVFTTDFEDSIADDRLRGGALAALETDWVALSAYTRGNDRVYFFKTGDGGVREVYEGDFPGSEIRFISPGIWEDTPGFWICLEAPEKNNLHSELQFWSRNPVSQPKETENAEKPQEVGDVQN